MDRDKLIRLIKQYDGGLTDRLADFLIAKGIGDITELREMYLKLAKAMDELKQGAFDKWCSYISKCETDEDYIAMENKLSAEKHRADIEEEDNAILREALKYIASCYASDTRKQRNTTDGVFIERTIQTALQQAAERINKKEN